MTAESIAMEIIKQGATNEQVVELMRLTDIDAIPVVTGKQVSHFVGLFNSEQLPLVRQFVDEMNRIRLRIIEYKVESCRRKLARLEK